MPTQPLGSTALTISRLAATRTAEVGDVLCDSHADYPAFAHVFPDPSRRQPILRSFFAATARAAQSLGTVAVATDGPRMLGAAVWLPPGAFPWPPRRKVHATGAMLQVMLRCPARLPAFAALGRNAERAFPETPHWYLQVLGVRAEARGRGLGTALVQSGLSLADEQQQPCYLETADPANVGYYEQFGFRLEREHHLIPHGPPHFAMRRPPHLHPRGAVPHEFSR